MVTLSKALFMRKRILQSVSLRSALKTWAVPSSGCWSTPESLTRVPRNRHTISRTCSLKPWRLLWSLCIAVWITLTVSTWICRSGSMKRSRNSMDGRRDTPTMTSRITTSRSTRRTSCGEQDKSDAEIIETYHGLWKIEETFKISKSDFRTRPIYVSQEAHIEAHLLTCFVALLLIRILELRMNQARLVAVKDRRRKVGSVYFRLLNSFIPCENTPAAMSLRTSTTSTTQTRLSAKWSWFLTSI